MAGGQSRVVSFISVVDFTENVTFLYVSESSYDLLGYEPNELVGRSALELVHPEELSQVKNMHFTTIMGDKAATVAYMRMKHKDPAKGYVLTAISRTVAEDVLVGSITHAVAGPSAMHTVSTASEVEIVTPEAQSFQFHRWNNTNPGVSSHSAVPLVSPTPSLPLHSQDTLDSGSSSSVALGPHSSPSEGEREDYPESERRPEIRPLTPPAWVTSFPPLPTQSPRVAFVLDRFSRTLPITYLSNTRILPATAVGRSFFDFVRVRDERLVRSWLEAVKGWSTGTGGPGASGGFGYGRFGLLPAGRSSRKDSQSRKREKDENLVAAFAEKNNIGGVGKVHQSRSIRTTREGRTSSVTSRRESQRRGEADIDVTMVDAIFSAHSDGLLVILRLAPETA